jgi:membrane dipeptidase
MIFDAHADILTDLYEQALKNDTNRFKTFHYPLYKASGITHSIFVNWTDPYQKSKHDFDQTFDVAIKALNEHKDIVKICYNHQDIVDAYKKDKLGVILGIEGLKYLSEPEDIYPLYQKGIRHAIITWNEVNSYGAGVSEPNGGLTEKGIKLVSIMEALGMIIDLSHANLQTFDDVMAHTKGPIIVSHANAKTLCDHRRNLTDAQLLKLKERGGVIGVCAVPYFISSNPENQTVDHLAKHIDYIAKFIGIDYIGLGLDVFYYLTEGKSSTGVKGLETIAQTHQLFDALTKLGYDADDIAKISHLNFDRIIKKVLG